MAAPPVTVRLEAAAGEDHAVGLEGVPSRPLLDLDPAHAALLQAQAHRPAAVTRLDVCLLRRPLEGRHQAGAASPRLQRQAAPEPALAVDLERLARIERNELDPVATHPAQRPAALRHQDLDQIRTRSAAAGPFEVLDEPPRRVPSEIAGLDLLLAQAASHLAQIVQAVVDKAHRGHREAAVSSPLDPRRTFQHSHRRAPLPGRQGSAQRRVAGADDDHAPLACCSLFHHLASSGAEPG